MYVYQQSSSVKGCRDHRIKCLTMQTVQTLSRSTNIPNKCGSCNKNQSICCTTCGLCLNCAQNAGCVTSVLRTHISVITKELRNTTMHLTNAEAEHVNFTFPEVIGYNNWNDVWKHFIDSMEYLINHLHSKLFITKKVKDKYIQEIDDITSGNALYSNFESAVEKLLQSQQNYKKLVDDVTKYSEDTRVNSEEIDSIKNIVKTNKRKINEFEREINGMCFYICQTLFLAI